MDWGWYAHAAALWQAPLAALALFLGLTFVFLLFFAIAALLVPMGRQQTRRSTFYGGLLRAFRGSGLPAGGHPPGGHRSGAVAAGRELSAGVQSSETFRHPVLLIRALPRQARLSFVTKQENFDLPVVRQFMHKLQCLPLDRHDDRQALRAILQAAKQLQEQPLCMTIFPEGRRANLAGCCRSATARSRSPSGQSAPSSSPCWKIPGRFITISSCDAPECESEFGVVPTEDVATLRTVQIGDRVHAMIAAALQADGA